MVDSTERRESFRMPFTAEVICRVNGTDYRGVMRDLSISGFFMTTTRFPQVPSECDIEIVLNGDDSRLRIDRLRGSIVRCDEVGIGVQFAARLEWLALVPIYFTKMEKQFIDERQ